MNTNLMKATMDATNPIIEQLLDKMRTATFNGDTDAVQRCANALASLARMRTLAMGADTMLSEIE